MNEQKKQDNEFLAADASSFSNSHAHPATLNSFFTSGDRPLPLKYLRWAVLFLLPVLILLSYPVDGTDYDLWWQMAHGKYYITHHTLKMDLSIFSWTPTDPSWIYNTCLGSIALYLFYNVLGGFGLWLFQWLIFGGIFLAFYFFLRMLNQRLDIHHVTIIATIAIVCYPACRFYKPELFSALLFCWTVFIFFYIKIKRTTYLFYLYPLIFALWINLHGAFLAGLFFLAMAFIGEMLNRTFFPQAAFTPKELTHFGIACVLSGIATLFNPYGMDYLTSLLPTIASEVYSQSHENLILAYESLWPYLKKPDVFAFNVIVSSWTMTLMILFVFALFAYDLFKKRSLDFTLLIVSVALYWKGMETSRASYFFPIAFFFIFFYDLTIRLKIEKITGKITFFSLLIFIFFFISISYYNMSYRTHNQWFGQGIDDLAPVSEVAFLKKYKLDVPIFNDYLIGGYLIWDLYPDYKVFIDPRGGLYSNQVFQDYMAFSTKPASNEDIKLFVKKYPFKIVVLHYRQMNLVFDFLRTGDEWHLLYFEKNAAIIVHRSILSAIYSKINKEIKNPQMLFYALNSPSRFKDVKNPKTLIHVFNFYVRLDPKAGQYIHDIFENNVSNLFKMKRYYLQVMHAEIKRQEQV